MAAWVCRMLRRFAAAIVLVVLLVPSVVPSQAAAVAAPSGCTPTNPAGYAEYVLDPAVRRAWDGHAADSLGLCRFDAPAKPTEGDCRYFAELASAAPGPSSHGSAGGARRKASSALKRVRVRTRTTPDSCAPR